MPHWHGFRPLCSVTPCPSAPAVLRSCLIGLLLLSTLLAAFYPAFSLSVLSQICAPVLKGVRTG